VSCSHQHAGGRQLRPARRAGAADDAWQHGRGPAVRLQRRPSSLLILRYSFTSRWLHMLEPRCCQTGCAARWLMDLVSSMEVCSLYRRRCWWLHQRQRRSQRRVTSWPAGATYQHADERLCDYCICICRRCVGQFSRLGGLPLGGKHQVTPHALKTRVHSGLGRVMSQGLFSALGSQATSVIKPAPMLPDGLAETVQVRICCSVDYLRDDCSST
jgi:hypothetical protein